MTKTQIPPITDWTPGSSASMRAVPDFLLPGLLLFAAGELVQSGVTTLLLYFDPEFVTRYREWFLPLTFASIVATIVVLLVAWRLHLRARRQDETRNQRLKGCVFELVNIKPDGALFTLEFRSPNGDHSLPVKASQLILVPGMVSGVQFPSATWTRSSLDFGRVVLIAELDHRRFSHILEVPNN